MSLRATSWAWAVSATPTAKLVLLALAEHADETGLCWPSVARIEQFTGLSERAIRGALRSLEDATLIVTDRREGRLSRYTLRIRPRQDVPPHPGSACPPTPAADAPHPGTSCPPPRQQVPETPAADAPEPSITVNEPSVNQVLALLPAAPSGRGTRLEPTWQPTPDDAGFADKLGLDPEAAAAEFRDYWLAVPGPKGRKLDWSATFRNSCRMLAKRRPKPSNSSQPWWMEEMTRERH